MEKQERNKHAEKKKKGQKEKEEEREREVRSADLNSGLCSTQKNYVTSVKNQRSSVITHRKTAEFGTALYFKHYHTSQIDECYHQMPLMERHFTDTLNST